MSIQPESGVIPQFTMADRLRKAREVTGLGPGEFADDIGVSRNTVTNYERGHVQPRKIVLNAWAMRTGVPLTWLMTGTENPRQDGPDGGVDLVRPKGFEPLTFCSVVCEQRGYCPHTEGQAEDFTPSVLPLRTAS